MTDPHNETDDITTARRCLEAYGGDIDRWPEDLRAQFGDFVKSAALEAERAGADALDALLSDATAPATPHDLKNRIDAGYRPSTEKAAGTGLAALAAWLKPLPAGAFAGMAALGFAAAAVIDSNSVLPPEYEAYVYLSDSGLAAFDEEAGAEWVAE